MSEEEKEAIEYIDNYIEKFRIVDNSKAYKKENIWNYFKFKHYKKIDTILNYIDKLQKDNYKLDRESQHYFDRIQDLQKELENLKEVDKQICNEELITKDKYQDILKENKELKEQRDNAIKLRNELIEDQKITCISKNIIRKFIKEELPDDEIMECCDNYDCNGVYLRKKLEELIRGDNND